VTQQILISGVAGFIGFHLAKRLLAANMQVVGIDNLNDYYDPALKRARLAQLQQLDGDFVFHQMDLADAPALSKLFAHNAFDRVVHLAAQAGVRYSLQNPQAYVQSNLVGFANLLEAVRQAQTPHLLFASSSSVYGLNTHTPFAEAQRTDAPISLYAATKKSNEVMAFTYSHLFDLPMTGLRFFTVYGPWGRPDMAYWRFTEKILRGEPIPVFNEGQLARDFTYIDDIVEGIVGLLDHIPDKVAAPQSQAQAPYVLYNLGHHQPVALLTFIQTLARLLGRPPQLQMLPMQPGDVLTTHADITAIQQRIGWQAQTSLESGLAAFVAWYQDYFDV